MATARLLGAGRYVVMGYIVMAYMVMGYIVTAYIVMALYSHGAI